MRLFTKRPLYLDIPMTEHQTGELAVLARFLRARGLAVECPPDDEGTFRVPAEQEEQFIAAMEHWTARQARVVARPRVDCPDDLLSIPRR